MFFLLLFFFAVPAIRAQNCSITSVEEVSSAIEACSIITMHNLTVPSGHMLNLTLKHNTLLILKGRITFDVEYQDYYPLIRIDGNGIIVKSINNAVIYGSGEKYWDGKGVLSERRKPVLLEIRSRHSTFIDLNIVNCPQNCVKIINSENLTLEGWNIDVSAGFKDNLAVDTHGFTILGSTKINIEDSNVTNKGDCVAVNDGSHLFFENIFCNGSEGLTIRPDWELYNFIKNVTFRNCSVFEGASAIRVLTSPHQPEGNISNIVYENIKVTNILFRGIDIRQDWNDEGRPLGNVKISKLDISNIEGNMKNKYLRSVYISCGTDGCDDWNWSNINIDNAEVENACNFLPNNWSCW